MLYLNTAFSAKQLCWVREGILLIIYVLYICMASNSTTTYPESNRLSLLKWGFGQSLSYL